MDVNPAIYEQNSQVIETNPASALEEDDLVAKHIDPNSILFMEDLAKILGGKCKRTIKRAIEAGQLPYPVKLGGNYCWTGSYILKHMNEQLEKKSEFFEDIEN